MATGNWKLAVEKHLQNFRAALIAQHSSGTPTMAARPLESVSHCCKVKVKMLKVSVSRRRPRYSSYASFLSSSAFAFAFDCVFNLICKLKCAVIVHSVHCTLVLVVATSPYRF